MTLIVMTVVVIACLIAGLAFYLFMIGTVLSRTAKILGDCLQSVRTVAGHAQGIGPGLKRLNKSGTDLLGAMPLLIEDADAVAAKVIPSAAPAAPSAPAPAGRPVAVGATAATPTQPGVGYMDLAPDPAPASHPTTGVGYLDV
ncbi:MAG TPA: hypothetical protein VFO16_24675 [Pseudonocardiaceae bacterium]|nr:hypothetical protein [Pseudonocardiaceae bacterium]